MLTLDCFCPHQERSSPAPVDSAMVEAATAQAAAMVVVLVVQLSPSPQSHLSVLPEEPIKKESQPFSPSETLKVDLNLDPFMVLCNTVKYIQEESWVSQKSDSQEFLRANMAVNTQGPSQWTSQNLFSFFPSVLTSKKLKKILWTKCWS